MLRFTSVKNTTNLATSCCKKAMGVIDNHQLIALGYDEESSCDRLQKQIPNQNKNRKS